ncbi:MAG: helix-turn-helix transcriptional regulator [Candidatus Gastranaerophilales bacterium]|nr:helix-turn-helix transcriptional regulator [Candidatus Gastranaerophilales bacterium]
MKIDLETLPKKFGKKIKIERIKRDISQEDLAELADLHRTTMWGVESGKNMPNLETIARLANALNMTLSEIVDLDF